MNLPLQGVRVVEVATDADARRLPLAAEGDGYFSGTDTRGRAGNRYKYRFEDREWPDPASRFNPHGVHGPAEVIDPRDFAWSDSEWLCPPLAELIIYELHIGAFTPAGKLPDSPMPRSGLPWPIPVRPRRCRRSRSRSRRSS